MENVCAADLSAGNSELSGSMVFETRRSTSECAIEVTKKTFLSLFIAGRLTLSLWVNGQKKIVEAQRRRERSEA